MYSGALFIMIDSCRIHPEKGEFFVRRYPQHIRKASKKVDIKAGLGLEKLFTTYNYTIHNKLEKFAFFCVILLKRNCRGNNVS